MSASLSGGRSYVLSLSECRYFGLMAKFLNKNIWNFPAYPLPLDGGGCGWGWTKRNLVPPPLNLLPRLRAGTLHFGVQARGEERFLGTRLKMLEINSQTLSWSILSNSGSLKSNPQWKRNRWQGFFGSPGYDRQGGAGSGHQNPRSLNRLKLLSCKIWSPGKFSPPNLVIFPVLLSPDFLL